MQAEAGRGLLMLAAIAFALFAVTAMLGADGIVTREVSRNYLSTNPAHATLDLGAVTPQALAIARAFPGIADAEARSVIEARAEVDGQWTRILVFVVDDFTKMRMNLFRPVSGAWPAPDGTMLVERMAAGVLHAREGDKVTIRTPAGRTVEVPVTGIVHDTTLAPAWQEQSGYGYLSLATWAALGEPPVLEELRIMLTGTPTQPEIDATALELAAALKQQGIDVHGVKVPPPGQHPHQGQISSALLMFLGLAVLALVLAAILIAAVLAASLARQAREIGVMKAIGARGGQIAVLYVVALLALGVLALAIAMPLGALAAGGLSTVMADTMNFIVADATVPMWVYGVVGAAGLLLPVIAALPSILRASNVTVREALTSTGVPVASTRAPTHALRLASGLGMTWLLAMRNAFRRRGRLILSLALLATGGGLFVTALSARDGWREIAASALTDRHYDVEFRLTDQVPEDKIDKALAASGAVKSHEVWGISDTAFANQGQLEVMRTYPDRGHGSFSIIGVPPATQLVTLPLIEGRWLTDADTDALVLTQQNHRPGSPLKIGDKLPLSVGGKRTAFTLVGVVREIGGGGAYINKSAYQRLAGPDARPMLRVVLDPGFAGGDTAALAAVEKALADASIHIERAVPITTLYLALAGHVEVPVTMLIAAAILLALIGGLGLASMTTINVLERTREIGVMKAVGARPAVILQLVVGEALFVAGLSWIAALLLALPLVWLIGLSGLVMFGTPLPYMISAIGAATWLALVLLIALIASAVPAWRASRLVVREALAYT
jgi:putative ABC transport system permease protein